MQNNLKNKLKGDKRKRSQCISALFCVPSRNGAQDDNPSQSKAVRCTVHTTNTSFPDGLTRGRVRKTDTQKSRAGVNKNTSGYGTWEYSFANASSRRLLSGCGERIWGKEMGVMIDLITLTRWPQPSLTLCKETRLPLPSRCDPMGSDRSESQDQMAWASWCH